MRRGFKSEAEDLALELRNELQLQGHDPINVFTLASHLAIPLVPLSKLKSEMDEEHYQVLSNKEASAFSGLTIVDGSKRLVVYNDAHAPVRQNSDVAHELAHALLGHPPHALADEYGCRHYNKEIEDEATWLSGAILVPRPAAMRIAFREFDRAKAADRYAVSMRMLNWRLSVTGAMKAIRASRGH